MKTAKNRTDELLPEYNLSKLRVRKLGPARKSFGPSIVRLESDVAEVFPSEQAVNEALRLFIQITKTMGLAPAESKRAPRSRKPHAAQSR